MGRKTTVESKTPGRTKYSIYHLMRTIKFHTRTNTVGVSVYILFKIRFQLKTMMAEVC